MRRGPDELPDPVDDEDAAQADEESRRDQRDNDAVDRWRDRQMEDC